jgi:REP element-mobilizing transposase RayT
MPDHTHILLGLRPNLALSDLVGDIKTGSTNHINEYLAGNASFRKRRETLRAAVGRRTADFSRSHIQTVKILRR